MPDVPEVSVVVASFSGEELLARCLESIRAADTSEVIVATNADDEVVRRLEKRFVTVRFVRAPNDARVFRLRTLGTAQARGEIIVLTEDHCTVSLEWIRALCTPIEAGHPVVGGPVDNGLSLRIYDWALYCCEYVAFMPPLPGGSATVLSGVNVGYRRDVLFSCQKVWQEAFYENEVHDALSAAGYRLWRAENALVFSHLEMSLGQAMAHLYGGGRHYGRYRQSRSQSVGRVLLALVSPAVPVVLFARIIKHVMARRPSRITTTLLGLPYIFCLLMAWSAGEIAGYLTSWHGAEMEKVRQRG